MPSGEVRATRLARVQRALEAAAADAIVVPASGDFRWLCGIEARVTERLLALVVPRSGAPFLVAPRLEVGPLASACPELDALVWDEHEDPLERLLARTGWTHDAVVMVGEGLRVPHVLRLAARTRCRPASEVLGPLRAVDDEDELAVLAQAAAHADLVVEEAADRTRAGMSERQLARTHRTGHGLGLEGHEPPNLVRGNRAPLAAGNVHGVEPGVHLPGRFGIRIEDIVVVETAAARRLNHAPIDLRPRGARA